MNTSSKETGDICKNHSARSIREFHIHPTKLSRSELENVYYALIEDNQSLKKTLNSQNEKIKLLTTKLMRMTLTQKSVLSKDQNRCCASSKAIISEQNDSIQDLMRTNERLSEKIRLLNMRMCSIKQFTRVSPKKCAKCSSNSIRKPSSSVLNGMKKSDISLNSGSLSTIISGVVRSSEHSASNKIESNKSSSRISKHSDRSTPRDCGDNRCRTQIEDLKKQIAEIQQVLIQSKEFESAKVKLEEEVLRLRRENVALKGECKAIEEAARQRDSNARQNNVRLHEAEARTADLQTQLCIEKKKVDELVMQLQSAELTNQITRIIDEQIQNVNSSIKEDSDSMGSICQRCKKMFTHDGITDKDVVLTQPQNVSTPVKLNDSGYSDSHEGSGYMFKSVSKLNDELKRKVVKLEAELDVLRVAAAAAAQKSKPRDEEENLDISKTYRHNKDSIQSTKFEYDVPSSHIRKGRTQIVKDFDDNIMTDLDSDVPCRDMEISDTKHSDSHLIEEDIVRNNLVISRQDTVIHVKENLAKDNDSNISNVRRDSEGDRTFSNDAKSVKKKDRRRKGLKTSSKESFDKEQQNVNAAQNNSAVSEKTERLKTVANDVISDESPKTYDIVGPNKLENSGHTDRKRNSPIINKDDHAKENSNKVVDKANDVRLSKAIVAKQKNISPPSAPGTYTVNGRRSRRHSGVASSDSTDYGVSSISESFTDKYGGGWSAPRSPGESRARSSELGYLSEGELPAGINDTFDGRRVEDNYIVMSSALRGSNESKYTRRPSR